MSKKKKSGKNPGIHKKDLSHNILGIFTNNPSRTYNYKQIAKQLLITDKQTTYLVNEVLHDLTKAGSLAEVYTGKFKLKSRGGYITGTVDMTTMGYGFIVSADVQDDVFVSQRNLHHALDGDTVKVYLFASKKGGRIEGEVIQIIEKARETFVGNVEISRNFAFLVPDNRKMPYDLFIPLEKLNGAKNGQKAIAKITDWPDHAKNPIGEIMDVLGYPGENDTEMHAILAEFELPYKFLTEVEHAAEKIKDKISRTDYEQRRDFRDVTTFTIDPADAKDFDDALSIRKLENGNREIGVHIADVTHYVSTTSMIDKEAQERGTSVYLVDRVVPMLPERLSNELCSLRPNEEKLCFSAVFEMNPQAEVLNEWFGRTIIHSNRRFTYEEAQQIIETGKGQLKDEMLALHTLAQLLREERFKKGAFGFERIEVKFDIDEKGHPLRVYFKENKESNQLIEEFMLLANKRVAEFIGKKKGKEKPKTFVYRIHDLPNPDKLDSFRHFIKRFGYRLPENEGKLAESMNQLLHEVKGKKEQNIVENLALRAMAKAVYSTENIGHYGLSFPHYTHFTSPIRRYPDMMVHRLLDSYLKGESSKSAKKYESMCRHSSDMERRATDAERASIKYKQVEFMSDKIGQIFDGVISGVTEWGLYVEITENQCEGMVAIRDLDDDFYVFDEENYALIGKHYKKVYQLGDQVKVEIIRANLAKKQLDMLLVDEDA